MRWVGARRQPHSPPSSFPESLSFPLSFVLSRWRQNRGGGGNPPPASACCCFTCLLPHPFACSLATRSPSFHPFPSPPMKNILRRLHLHPSPPPSPHDDLPPDCSKPSFRTRISLPDAASELLSIAKNTFVATSNSLRFGKDPPPPLSHTQEHSDVHVPELEQQHHAAMDAVAAAACSASPLAAVLALDSRNAQSLEDSVQDPPSDRLNLRLERSNTAVLQLVSDQALLLQDEDLQVQVAMALSVRDDPEAAAIEAAKDLTSPPPNNSTAELLAYQFWKCNVLNYEDKVLDGFYDVYGITSTSDSSLETMPTLINLEEAPVSNKMSYEVVLVNRVTDDALVSLEQKAISISLSSTVSVASRMKKTDLIQRIANIVAEQMGGAVTDPDTLFENWGTSSAELRLSLGKTVLPLGHLRVLADAVGVPCKLVKGRQYTGSDKRAVNIIKINSREYAVDLMASPGRLSTYNSDFVSDQQRLTPCISPTLHDMDGDLISIRNVFVGNESVNIGDGPMPEQTVAGTDVPEMKGIECRGNERQEEPHAFSPMPMINRYASHWRSPSWTEGMQESKGKDVSQYVIDVAKENPKLARKICDILLEGGFQVPSDLSNNIPTKEVSSLLLDEKHISGERQSGVAEKDDHRKDEDNDGAPGRTPSPSPERPKDRLQRLNSVQGLGDRRPLDPSSSTSPNSSESYGASVLSSIPVLSPAAVVSLGQENLSPEIIKKVPVAAAAAAATAAVVASSMVVAASKSDLVSDPSLEVPVAAAAATATAAVVVATSAVVGKRIDLSFSDSVDEENSRKSQEEERLSGKSSESVSSKSVGLLDDVAEWEIPWEELVVGERIGLGSYGEVYRGEWHGTEVAIKKFLDQDISGDALEEFRSEVRLMKRMRHPNVVLFMGAVMRAPNLSIVTEFLPRGSLYRLIHRSNSQLDERKRLRMALDVARGMNYLHSSTPVIVHRDLKSPNLLVDKNWVVKVCDFGLSRMKHNTFLSSKSTAGTPEWMAPEVLRNEPSNEKSDVFSFGVILWELATLQQPWGDMNPMQVVGAVGFQDRTLDIPEDLDPAITRIIRQCWQGDPAARPSFTEIMQALKPLQKPLMPQNVKA